jgi:hypothetical protein
LLKPIPSGAALFLPGGGLQWRPRT